MASSSEPTYRRELAILERLDEQNTLSQRALSRKVGMALGLTNSLLKKMVRRGWIKVRRLDAKRLAYLVTPEGVAEKLRLWRQRAEDTLQFYLEARRLVRERLEPLYSRGLRRVGIYGTDNVAELVYLVVKEVGLEPVAVFDDRKAGREWLGFRVRAVDSLRADELDAVVLAELHRADMKRFVEAHPELPCVTLRPVDTDRQPDPGTETPT